MKKSEKIVAAVIPAIAVVVAALIGIYPAIREHATNAVIAGIVVEQDTNRGIAQATIVVAGRTEEYVTEDTGNFRIVVNANAPNPLRLHVSKAGFQPLDKSVSYPAENVVLQLRK